MSPVFTPSCTVLHCTSLHSVFFNSYHYHSLYSNVSTVPILVMVLGATSLMWEPDSRVPEARSSATSVRVPTRGVYILGGFRTSTTSTLLRPGATSWVPGPTLPGGGAQGGCAVALGDHGFLLIGGIPHYDQVREFNMETGQWLEEKRWDKLLTGRYKHGCSVLGDQIVVAGGHDTDGNILNSTEVLSISQKTRKPGGRLHAGRAHHAMVTLGGEGDSHTLYAMGGYVGNSNVERSVERFDEDKFSWVIEVTGLQEGRTGMGAVAIRTADICPT